ncbi:MAG: histidine kinase dimerization/phospho-acceptor domain-containing protein, partial [Pseudomonadota bacterium]
MFFDRVTTTHRGMSLEFGDLRTLMDATPMAQILVARDRRVAISNTAAKQLSNGESEGRHFITALRQPALVAAVEACFSSGQEQACRYRNRVADIDQVYDVVIRLVALPGIGGQGDGVLVSFTDQSQIESTDQMRRDFVANVSHELRTPLTSIAAFIETLQGPGAEDDAARRRFLELMRRETERMTRLVTDLLSLSRVESDGRLRTDETVDVVETLNLCIAAREHSAEFSGVTLMAEPFPHKVMVNGDAGQITQVFANLLENAAKYGAGYIEVKIQLMEQEPVFRGPGVKISVTDNG